MSQDRKTLPARITDIRAARKRDPELVLRGIAAALYGIAGVDATEEQLEKARKAAAYYREGKPVSLIMLLLRIPSRGKAPARLPVERIDDELPEAISLYVK